MISKDKLKGKYITYLDNNSKYRTHKVVKINGLMLTVVNAVGKKTRIHPDKNKSKKYGVKIFGRQLKNKLENDINIDILDVIREARHADISFDMMLSHCVSHEIIHNILMMYEGIFVARDFDKICYDKNENFKEWIGGMV